MPPLDKNPAVRLESMEARAELAALLSGYSIEAIPSAVKPDGAVMSLPSGTHVYIPAIPGTDIAEAVAACRILAEAGLVPVPHLAARAIAGLDDLRARLAAFSNAGASALMLIAGDVKVPAGPYTSTLDILETGLLAEFGFRRLGVAGHPEGLAAAAPGEVERALHVKCAYAQATGSEMWIVTQFTFAPEPIIDWLGALRRQGISLPVRIGIAGPASLRKLIAYAVRCGVGNSLRFLTDRPGSATRLLGRWAPDDLLGALARHSRGRPEEAAAGIHVYPFGGIASTAGWLEAAGYRDEPDE